MSKHGQPMSQTLAQMHLNELKMNDPKLNKIFDKLKKGNTVKIKHSSTLERGKDFIEYIVKSKNVVNKGRVEKITLASKDNPTAVKKFLYKRDGKVTFAVGDMAASIDDIKEKYSIINHEIIEEIELDEMDMKYVLINMQGKVQGYASDKKDALDIARRTKSTMHPIKKKISDKTLDKMNALQKTPKELKDLGIIEEVELDEKLNPNLLKRMDDDNLKSYYLAFARDPIKMAPQDREIFKALTPEIKKRKIKFDKSEQDLIKKAMKSAKNPNMYEEVELDEASARDDAMRAMGRGRRVDPADVDEPSASDADKKGADKNMIMQMRKAMDVKGNMKIEFGDGRKEKVDPKILQLMITAHGKIQKPRDKEKFVAMISKSKRDMLNVAKKLSTLKMDLDKEDEPTIKKVIGMLKKASDAHAGQAKDLQKTLVDEGKMKQFHMMQDDGKSAEEIAKALKLDLKTVKALMKEEVELDEKYDLYHKTFSGAMQHAYDYAKKKLGITVDPKEIDNKVATGPRKPSEGKTNKYRLKGKGGNLQIQVYNKGGSKPFELNMYKEENDMTKSLKDTVLEMWSEAVSPAQQAAIAISKKEKGEKPKDEGNAFGAALEKARKNGDKTFTVAGKEYDVKTEEEKLDKVNPTAVKKKFDDRKDKDIDNDGDVDSTDKYLHKRRKAISKAVKSEEFSTPEYERYLETKRGSLRDSVLKIWGENVQEYVQSDGVKRRVKEGDNRLKTNKTLTKEKKDGIKKMTDTGKEVTPVETSVKMPKIKETKNKV